MFFAGFLKPAAMPGIAASENPPDTRCGCRPSAGSALSLRLHELFGNKKTMQTSNAKYWKQSDSTDVRSITALHEGDGVIDVRPFFNGLSQTGVQFHVWELAPGASEGNHIHQCDDNFEEIYYFFQGRGVMWIEGEDVPIEAGDAILVPPGVDHGFRNTGDEPLRLVLLFGKPQHSSGVREMAEAMNRDRL